MQSDTTVLTLKQKKVADLTVEELEAIIDAKLQPIWDYLFELEEQLPDPDAGKRLKSEVEARLRANLEIPLSKKAGIPADEVYRELGLDE